jgi:hypothetical protein
MDGMAKLMARAGRGLTFKLPNLASKSEHTDDETDDSDNSDDEEKEPDRPFEPLCVWTSPHPSAESNGQAPAEPKGLPPAVVTELRPDENGIEERVTVLRPAPVHAYSKQNVYVPPVLAKWLRPHQREGVQFIYECVMGLKDFNGHGWYVTLGHARTTCCFTLASAALD